MKKKIIIFIIVLIIICISIVCLFGLKYFYNIKENNDYLLPDKIETIDLRYAPLYNISTANALNSTNNFINFQTIKLNDNDFVEISNIIKTLKEDKSFYDCDCIIFDELELIVNDSYKITVGSDWGEVEINNDKFPVKISSELYDKLINIEKINNDKIFNKIETNNISVLKENENINIIDEAKKEEIISNTKYLKVNINDDYETYDDGYIYTLNFDNNVSLYIYNSKIGYLKSDAESTFIIMDGDIEKVLTNLSKSNKYRSDIIYSQYINMTDIDKAKIINNYEDLVKYVEKYNNYKYDSYGNKTEGTLDILLKNYSSLYFDNKSLALIYVPLTSGSNSVSIENIIEENNILEVSYKINAPSIGTMDMSGYILLVEIGKNITQVIYNEE